MPERGKEMVKMGGYWDDIARRGSGPAMARARDDYEREGKSEGRRRRLADGVAWVVGALR